MRRLRLFALLACLACVPPLHAAGACPLLPEAAALRWDEREVPGFSFCKALAVDTGVELFSVTIGESTPFRPQNALLAGSATIDGHKVRWYRGQDGFDPELQLRETVIRLARRRIAHIVVRARDEAQLQEGVRLAEGLRFNSP